MRGAAIKRTKNQGKKLEAGSWKWEEVGRLRVIN
jgi:hypothetical protein